jgi:hypothetical protein
MTDKIIAIASMLDGTDGERDNASRILQRTLASRDSTLTEFLSAGLFKLGVTSGLQSEILADAVFPFDTARINRLTDKLKQSGLSWRAIARGTTNNATDEEEAQAQAEATAPKYDLDPYDALFGVEGRRTVSIEPLKKMLYEWKREELADNIVALVNVRERLSQTELKVSAYTQDAETVIAFGDFIIKGTPEEIESVIISAGADRALMYKVNVPKNDKKPMTLELL